MPLRGSQGRQRDVSSVARGRQPRATLPTPATAPDLPPPPPHLPPCPRRLVRPTVPAFASTADNLAHHRNPPPGAAPCAAPARFLDPPLITRSRALSWTSAGSSMTLDASLTVTRPCSTASRAAGAAGLSSDSTLAA